MSLAVIFCLAHNTHNRSDEASFGDFVYVCVYGFVSRLYEINTLIFILDKKRSQNVWCVH